MQTTFSSSKRSSTISLNLIVPDNWQDLSDKQLRYVYQHIADEFNSDELKTLCLLKWSNLKVVGRQDNGSYLLKRVNYFFQATQQTLALCSTLSDNATYAKKAATFAEKGMSQLLKGVFWPII